MIKGSAGNGLPLNHERSFKRALIGFAVIDLIYTLTLYKIETMVSLKVH
jgi:hypothetical protein